MKRRAERHANRAVAYVRVSKEEQSLSPEAQRDAMARWSAVNGVEIVATFEEDVSGGAPLDKRFELLAAIDALVGHEAAVLLVARRDRLARDVFTAGMVERLVERQGARVLSADGLCNGQNPEGQLMRGIVDLFAQHERALIRSRTKSALAVKKGRRERVGSVPYGFRLGSDGIHLEPDEREQEAVGLIRTLRAERKTLREIVARLNADRIPCRSGRRWHLTSVARVLKREIA